MLDSTYVTAADPNSMRDQGVARNAEYCWKDQGYFSQKPDKNSRQSESLGGNNKTPRELSKPFIMRYGAYTKNISEAIMTPACVPADNRPKTSNFKTTVRLTKYRDTTQLFFGYNPEPPKICSKRKLDHIRSLRSRLNQETEKRRDLERQIAQMRSTIKSQLT